MRANRRWSERVVGKVRQMNQKATVRSELLACANEVDDGVDFRGIHRAPARGLVEITTME